MQATLTSIAPFQAVPEQNQPFLALFPHRFDFIWAERPAPGTSPQWKTDCRYPLSDRQLLKGTHLYGVRFGATTRYLMIDIDRGSPYHPQNDRLAIPRLVETLEALGFVSFLPCTSSYSGGLHLYFPFEQPQKCWDLAFAVQTLLQRAGFKVAPGYLELFPNPKLYVVKGTPNLYAAHRLPLQEPGSYLLTDDWQLRSTSQIEFVRLWHYVAARNAVHASTITSLVNEARPVSRGLSQSARKFLTDLNTEIEQGWSGHGQTNRLLGRIAMRSYIFGSHLRGIAAPLEGVELIQDIVQTAQQLPGYQEWCRHQHEIHKRAEEWACCVENSRYFPYGHSHHSRNQLVQAPLQLTTKSWNRQQEDDARTRIRQAVVRLLNQGQLPSTTTARFQRLVGEGIGGSTLYRHRDLWHPAELQSQIFEEEMTPSIKAGSQSKEDYDPALKSLLGDIGRNGLSGEDLSDRQSGLSEAGRNFGFTRKLTELDAAIQQRQQQWLQTYQERLQSYLDSGDPILMAEARANWVLLEGLHGANDQGEQITPGGLLSDTDGCNLDAEPVQQDVSHRGLTDCEAFHVLVEAIAYHRTRLGWSESVVQQQLLACTGKPIQALLTDRELVRWVHFLEKKNCDG